MPALPIYQVDAFTDALFAGNPAAVVPLEAWLDDATLQAIAMENNLAETAFFIPTPDAEDSDYHLRWFTPTVEMDLCGHATLASAWVLFNQLGLDGDSIRFQSRSGVLGVTRDGEKISMNFPAGYATPTLVPDGLAQALGGIEPVGFLRGEMDMAILSSEEEVRAVKPDLSYISGLGGHLLIVTAPGDGSDVASRCFAPSVGIDEDPVTGGAHCFIVPYWTKRLEKDALHCRQVSARSGDLWCHMDGERVVMQGKALLYMTGSIHL